MGVKVDGRQLHHLHIADGIVLIKPSISQAERMLTEFDETCGCIGLQLNLQKTMFMRDGWVSDAPFTLNGTIPIEGGAAGPPTPDTYRRSCDGSAGVRYLLKRVRRVHRRQIPIDGGATGPPASDWCAGAR
ncbi:hypothetical protein RB195_019902 [Necator americanus]|uniref:Reverse transcriptase domain-containing protein n=1 Tax=Necator americanus TaxID=51031 RepID=A0ABR1CGB0_NECAM